MPEWLMQFAVPVIGAVAVYGGIRADLKRTTESVARAHARIDDHLDFHIQRGQKNG